jgi:hypothetical protein
MKTLTLSAQSISDITTDADRAMSVQHWVGQAPITEVLELDTSENIRAFVESKRRTPLHKEILATLQDSPVFFPILNGGLTIVASEIKQFDSSIHLTNPSIINGGQTQGVIRQYLAECEKREESPNFANVKIELLITQDANLKARASVARNSQHAVQKLSIAGRLGYLDDLNRELQLELPDLKLRTSESDIGPEFVDAEHLLQILYALVPKQLLISGDSENRSIVYSSKNKLLKDFAMLYRIVNGELEPPKKIKRVKYEMLYDFLCRLAPSAYELYLDWSTKSQFAAWPSSAIQTDSSGSVIGVRDGVLLPIIASLSNFVVKGADKKWSIQYPELFDPTELIQMAKHLFIEFNNSDSSLMGRNAQSWSTLYQVTHIYSLSARKQSKAAIESLSPKPERVLATNGRR